MSWQNILCAVILAIAAAFFAPRIAARVRARRRDWRTARWLLIETGRLASAGANWTQIFETVNPAGNQRVQALLIELRGPHMFVPLTGLKVIEEGCRLALRANPQAGLVESLEEAIRSADRVVEFGR